VGSEPRLRKEALYAELGYLESEYEKFDDKRISEAVAVRKEIKEIKDQLDEIEK